MKKNYISLAITCLFATGACAADTLLEEVVTSVNRYEQKAFDTAASVNVVNKTQIQDQQAQVSLSESMIKVPGLYALNRQNYAQDVLISSRGFGANSAFGARGIKIYVDGIPATISDGQGQTSHIDLASAEKIEVLRGPFTSIYGNSAGGVINVTSEKGQPGNEVTPYASYGSFGSSKIGVKASGDNGPINYLLDASRFETSGSRDHSAATKDNENAKLVFGMGGDSQLAFVGNKLTIHAQDPLGLTSADVNNQSQGSGHDASLWNARKDVTQEQGGFSFTKRLEGQDFLKLTSYYGNRQQQQYQAPSSTTKLYNSSSSSSAIESTPGYNIYQGGLIALDRNFYGADTQLSKKVNFIGYESRLIMGAAYDRNSDHSTSYCNSYGQISNCAGGVSSLYTNASYAAYNFDQYAQLETFLSEKLTFNTGLRHTSINLSASNNSYNSSQGNWTSGARDYSATLPMASLMYALGSATNVYASVGKGLDTPTLNQIKYQYANSPTVVSYIPNFLDASTTTQYELGIKQKFSGVANLSLALFQAETNKEVVAEANISGKGVYTNANHTERKGIEFLGQFQLPQDFGLTFSYTYLIAKVVDAYVIPGGSIAAGNYIPGVPKQKLFTDLFWRSPDQSIDVGVEVIASSGLYATDSNLASSAGYAILNARVGLKQKSGHWTFNEFARVNNISDRYYVGSVIVNQSSSQFYEPAPGRNWIIGAKAAYKF